AIDASGTDSRPAGISRLTPAQLAEHSQWIRRLATALIRREDVADDLVQETWLIALRAEPDPTRPLRAWLAAVLRNLVFKRHRGDGRRSRREQRAALEPNPEIPTPELLVGHDETRKVLAGLVLEIGEPYRTTLLLHFF